MRTWSWYWARLWEPAARTGARRRAQPESEPGTSRLPPAAARRALRRRGGGPARAAAAARLQPLLGNRHVARAAGARLPEQERLGAAYGDDLSDVRVAVDPVAAAAAGARAFTVGDQIVVDSAAPGRGLLAEEAAHVVQARRRGIAPGISERSDGGEGQARSAAAAAGRGGAVPDLAAGAPVAAVQRQQAAAGPGAGVLVPDVVRTMLVFQHSVQGGEGPLEWTRELEAEFARLMPSTDISAIRRLWDPAPPTPGIGFQRMVDAGLFPTLIAPPPEAEPPEGEPEPPTPPPEPEPEPEPEPPVGEEPSRPGLEAARTPFRAGILGLHLQVGTPPPLPPEAVAARPFLERGIRLSDDQLGGILAGRAQAARQFDALLGVVPGLDRATRGAVAAWMADLALSNTVRAQARADAPSALEQSEAATAGFAVPRPPSVLDVLPSGGPVRQLLDLVDGIGFTVTIHFDL